MGDGGCDGEDGVDDDHDDVADGGIDPGAEDQQKNHVAGQVEDAAVQKCVSEQLNVFVFRRSIAGWVLMRSGRLHRVWSFRDWFLPVLHVWQ